MTQDSGVRRVAPEIRQQYRTTDPLQTRIATHERYSERQIDLHAACREALNLRGDEALLDVGCGPGDFPLWLRAHGHGGRIAGLDQSEGMIAAARSAAEQQGAAIDWFIGEANALPFADGEFSVISARHMLYHVPDIPGALREFARVMGPEGRVLATTNAGTSQPHITALQRDMQAHFDLPTFLMPNLSFRTDNAREILSAVFPFVEETILSNAFIFTEPEPIVAYIMTTRTAHQTQHDAALHQEIYDWLLAETTRRLAAMGGTWRDPKDVGLYVCRMM